MAEIAIDLSRPYRATVKLSREKRETQERDGFRRPHSHGYHAVLQPWGLPPPVQGMIKSYAETQEKKGNLIQGMWNSAGRPSIPPPRQGGGVLRCQLVASSLNQENKEGKLKARGRTLQWRARRRLGRCVWGIVALPLDRRDLKSNPVDTP